LNAEQQQMVAGGQYAEALGACMIGGAIDIACSSI